LINSDCECPEAYYKAENECLACPANCISCADSETCQSCEPGLVLENDQCVQCPQGTILSGTECKKVKNSSADKIAATAIGSTIIALGTLFLVMKLRRLRRNERKVHNINDDTISPMPSQQRIVGRDMDSDLSILPMNQKTRSLFIN